MSTLYTREQLKICIAKMCITIGWHSSMTTPIEILTDTITNYLYQLGRAANEYANGFGMNEPNLDHLGLAFRDFYINTNELEDYVRNVDCEPPAAVPKYPIPKEDHLNFLKPGSKEVVTRPVHIHEHLPPMNPVLEVNQNQAETSNNSEASEEIDVVDNTSPVFKRPTEILQGEGFKRPRLLIEDEGRPTREISSVMMTTSGFLSPAREGKLPESRTPMPALEPIVLPPPVPPESVEPPPNKKVVKTGKKIEKKKEKVGRELFKPIGDQMLPKKLNPKELSKVKMKHSPNVHPSPVPNLNLLTDLNISVVASTKTNTSTPQKFNRALAAARLKTEKLNTTITPIPIKSQNASPVPAKIEPHVDKLFTEPDKKKINILKKISVKTEKISKIKEEIRNVEKQESRESSPDLIIDESTNEASNKVHHLSNDITIELVDVAPLSKVPDKTERLYFYDDSPPGTPSTPKTPEMISQSPPLSRGEKRKRKDKSKVKKIQKLNSSPVRLDQDIADIDMERPKTPEAHVLMKPEKIEPSAPAMPFPFFSPFAGPGLIPTPLGNPLFPHLGLPPLGMPSFGHAPYIPPVHPNIPMNFMQSRKQEEVMRKSPSIEKSTSVTKPNTSVEPDISPLKLEKKTKEHKKEKKDKLKKKNKKDKVKNKAEKKKSKAEKKDKEKIKKEKREKRKEKEVRESETVVPKLTLKLGSVSPHPHSPEIRKLNIKPVVKKEDEVIEMKETKREMSPELAKISALVTGQPKPKNTNVHSVVTAKEDSAKEDGSTNHSLPSPRTGPGPGRPRIHPIKSKPTKLNKQQHPMVKDAVGNTVWYCPACGKQDDGSPMIGCDDCDAWYHWVCVGIQIPPDESENWYCRLCISKKQEVLQSDKKKKRKKREKKEH